MRRARAEIRRRADAVSDVVGRAEVGGVLGPSAGVLRVGGGAVRGGVPPRAYPPWFG